MWHGSSQCVSAPGPHPPEFGPDIPAGDVQSSPSELAEMRDGELIDASGDVGPWALLWGSLGVAFSLVVHGPIVFLTAMMMCGAAFIAWLLCRRRSRGGTPQSGTMAWAGLLLGLLGLGLGFAGLVGHPLLVESRNVV